MFRSFSVENCLEKNGALFLWLVLLSGAVLATSDSETVTDGESTTFDIPGYVDEVEVVIEGAGGGLGSEAVYDGCTTGCGGGGRGSGAVVEGTLDVSDIDELYLEAGSSGNNAGGLDDSGPEGGGATSGFFNGYSGDDGVDEGGGYYSGGGGGGGGSSGIEDGDGNVLGEGCGGGGGGGAGTFDNDGGSGGSGGGHECSGGSGGSGGSSGDPAGSGGSGGDGQFYSGDLTDTSSTGNFGTGEVSVEYDADVEPPEINSMEWNIDEEDIRYGDELVLEAEVVEPQEDVEVEDVGCVVSVDGEETSGDASSGSGDVWECPSVEVEDVDATYEARISNAENDLGESTSSRGEGFDDLEFYAEPAVVETGEVINTGSSFGIVDNLISDFGVFSELDVLVEYRELGEENWDKAEIDNVERQEEGTSKEGFISGLESSTEYEYRTLVEWNSNETGSTETFETEGGFSHDIFDDGVYKDRELDRLPEWEETEDEDYVDVTDSGLDDPVEGDYILEVEREGEDGGYGIKTQDVDFDAVGEVFTTHWVYVDYVFGDDESGATVSYQLSETDEVCTMSQCPDNFYSTAGPETGITIRQQAASDYETELASWEDGDEVDSDTALLMDQEGEWQNFEIEFNSDASEVRLTVYDEDEEELGQTSWIEYTGDGSFESMAIGNSHDMDDQEMRTYWDVVAYNKGGFEFEENVDLEVIGEDDVRDNSVLDISTDQVFGVDQEGGSVHDLSEEESETGQIGTSLDVIEGYLATQDVRVEDDIEDSFEINFEAINDITPQIEEVSIADFVLDTVGVTYSIQDTVSDQLGAFASYINEVGAMVTESNFGDFVSGVSQDINLGSDGLSATYPAIEEAELVVEDLGGSNDVYWELEVYDPSGEDWIDTVMFNDFEESVEGDTVELDVGSGLNQEGELVVENQDGKTDSLDVGFMVQDNVFEQDEDYSDLDSQRVIKEDLIDNTGKDSWDYEVEHVEVGEYLENGSFEGSLPGSKDSRTNVETDESGDNLEEFEFEVDVHEEGFVRQLGISVTASEKTGITIYAESGEELANVEHVHDSSNEWAEVGIDRDEYSRMIEAGETVEVGVEIIEEDEDTVASPGIGFREKEFESDALSIDTDTFVASPETFTLSDDDDEDIGMVYESTELQVEDLVTVLEGEFLEKYLDDWVQDSGDVSTVDEQFIKQGIKVNSSIEAEWDDVEIPEGESPEGFGECDVCDTRNISFTGEYNDSEFYLDSGDVIVDELERTTEDVVLGERETYFEDYSYSNIEEVDFENITAEETIDTSEFDWGSYMQIADEEGSFGDTTFELESAADCDSRNASFQEFEFENETWRACAKDRTGSGKTEFFKVGIPSFSERNVRFGGFIGEEPEEEVEPFAGLTGCDDGEEFEELVCYRNQWRHESNVDRPSVPAEGNLLEFAEIIGFILAVFSLVAYLGYRYNAVDEVTQRIDGL